MPGKAAEVNCDDEMLAGRVTNYLGTRHIGVLRKLDVQATGGTVTLTGRVNSFHQRQVALHSCRRVAGVRNVVDELEVTS